MKANLSVLTLVNKVILQKLVINNKPHCKMSK